MSGPGISPVADEAALAAAEAEEAAADAAAEAEAEALWTLPIDSKWIL